MKKSLLIAIASTLMLTACGDDVKKNAEKLINEAQALYEKGDLNAARACIDSLKKAFPNIVDARKAALRLHQDVELKAAQAELALTDSLLQLANRELEAMQQKVDEHKKALKATPEELTALTKMRIQRDSIRTQFETLGMKIRYIHQKQKEGEEGKSEE